MSSGRILIADDEPSVRDSVGYALVQEGFDVTPAADGDEAAELLGNGVPFDLLILDIMMPGPSGLDICREVRARIGWSADGQCETLLRSNTWGATWTGSASSSPFTG